MPHSALQTGQYSKWRGGKWLSSFDSVLVDFGFKTAWDLERLQPNTFFPSPGVGGLCGARGCDRRGVTTGRRS